MLLQSDLIDLFDYRDGNLVYKKSVGCRKAGSLAGTPHKDGYTTVKIKGKHYLLHRLIFMYHHGYFPEEVDHIDRDRSNNHIENLRESDKVRNQINRRKPKLTYDKRYGTWVARIASKYLGASKDKEKAQRILDEAYTRRVKHANV